MPALRVLLVDASQPFLDAAAHFLAEVPGIDVVGCLLASHETLAASAKLHPDLVLINLAMPEMGGLVVTLHLKALPDPPRVIIVTDYDQAPYRELAAAVQADGFVSKREFATHLVPSIRKLFETELLCQ
ncbi:MAG: response regulator [Planctomycetota bacterium]|nr:response regulator [Planctomycetota bacterium]